jgi:hypothetical protein
MKYIEIPLTKCTVFLTKDELSYLLQQEPQLYKEALSRGKCILRKRTQKFREKEKNIKQG